MAVLNKLSRYRDISTLGSGGMATVVLAQDTLLGRQVALKRMHTAADPSGTSRLRREALVGASISHANLVSVYDVVTTDEGDVVIVMEYVEGENLREALRREGQLPVTETVRILEGVAAGLDAIHQQGIVHRDVKPANILLGTNSSVKLADLGIAAVSDRTRITSAGTVLGSFSYMAPEQLEDAPATPAIDIYALSAVAYEALSGVQAHRESNPVAVAHAIATQPPPDLRQVWSAAPPAAAELLLRAMARDPAQRPRSASELVARLGAALEPQATQRAPAPTPRARKPSPAPIAAAGGALAGAAAGAGAAEGVQAASSARQPLARGNATRPDAVRRGPSGPPPPPAPPGARRTARALVPLALLAAIGVVAVILLGQGSKSPSPSTNASHTSTSTNRAATTAHRATTSTPSHTSSATTTPPTTTTQSTSTAAAAPTTTTPAAPAPTGASGSPPAAVASFYELAASHNYAQAWKLADPVFQNQLGGYDSFKSGQAGDKAIIFHTDRVVSQTGHTATVAVQTTSERTDGTHQCQGTVQLQNESGSWLLHAISINCSP
ncbi:MAG: eukaryotic-like serine/threonine-protein kinase [Solirubrobacteraceae bacterium]|nr:eukaryotic-like serine/threonine-protein kinase [Solirubrobacteraceae bacterium]